MKKVKYLLSLAFTFAFLLSACNNTNNSENSGESAGNLSSDVASSSDTPVSSSSKSGTSKLTPRDTSQEMKVLFIGNSFTYHNDLNQPDGIFANIAKNAGYSKVSVSTVYKGGYYLRQFLDESDTYGKQVITALKSSTKYDIVILQEQSSNSIKNPGDFYKSCREFKKLIDANGAEMWLYSTWGYIPGHAELPTLGPTTEEMEMKIRAAYTAIGEELNVPVIYAGAAMTKARQDLPNINLYKSDYYHPSLNASYLVAWTIFGTTFGVNPLNLTYNGSIPSTTADDLRYIASYIVRNGAPVDEKYKTSSVGVEPNNLQTEMLTSVPSAPICSVIYRDSAQTGNGWMTCKTNSKRTFSGIRGDKDAIASLEYSDSKLTDAQKQDIADIGYGVSVIGLDHMDGSKDGTIVTTDAGKSTAVGNLVNGHWGKSYMSALVFDNLQYNIDGTVAENGKYTSLITLNFGKVTNFDAIGYFSGNLEGFPQAQDVYVSDDGKEWAKVETACFDRAKIALTSIDCSTSPDPWNSNKASTLAAFSMDQTSGKYVRVGVIRGGVISTNTTGLEEINTRELVVYGTDVTE